MSKPTYHATAERSEKWWAISVHDLPEGLTGVTQGKTREEAELMARDVIACLLDVPEDSFDVELEFKE